MAKKKIGEIYNKPIVIGDKNLMNSNDIMFISDRGIRNILNNLVYTIPEELEYIFTDNVQFSSEEFDLLVDIFDKYDYFYIKSLNHVFNKTEISINQGSNHCLECSRYNINSRGKVHVNYIILERYKDGSYIGSYRNESIFNLPEDMPV